MSKLINALDLREIPLKSFLSILSMRHQGHALRGLQGVLDDEEQVALLEKYAGSYWRAPTARSIDQTIADLELLSRWDAHRWATRHGDVNLVTRAYRALKKAAARAGVKEEDVKLRVEELRAELKGALLWHGDLKAWAEKHPDGLELPEDAEPVQDVTEPAQQATPAPEPARHCEECRALVPQALGGARCDRCQPVTKPAHGGRELQMPEGARLCTDCGKPTNRAHNARTCLPCMKARRAASYKTVAARAEVKS